MTTKQERKIIDAIYASNVNLWLIGMLLSVQLSGWNSWESIWLTVGFALGVLGTVVRNARASA